MADKTPVRVVFNGSNVATGMAEFQTGETVPVANGGTGLSAIGSAGQIIKVNAAGSGLEFSGEGDLSITNLVAPSNADLNLRTSGTGGIILNDITISDNAISTNRSNDDFKINASGSGTIILENLKVGTSGATVTTILDEDNLSSDSATSLATQQSIKAYVDSELTAVSTTSISQGNSNVTVVDSGTGNVTIEVDGTDRITTVAATTTTATGHSLVIGAGSNSAAGQIKFLEGTDNGTNGVTLIGAASTADVTVTLPAAADTLVGKATTDTFTNKTIDANGTGNSITNLEVADLASGVLDTDITSVSGSDDTLASAKAIKTYVDAQVTASDLDFATDDSTALSIDLDSESLQVSGGANISTSGSGNTITIALDTALTGLSSVTSTALVTNSISSSDSTAVRIDDALNVDGALDVGAGFTISNTTSITSIVDEDAMGSDSATALATQQSIKAYADTKAVLTGSTNNTITTVTGAHAIQGESALTFDGSTLAVTGAVTISGDLTVSGDTTTVSTTNTTIADNIIELNTGISQSLNDAGIIIERGSTGNNAAIIWDESEDEFILGTTTATAGDKSSGITVTAGNLKVATIEATTAAITGGSITGITDLTVADGGTGASTLTDGGVLLGSGTGAITAMAVLADGEMIVGDGTTDPVAESGATLRTSIGVGTGDSPQFTGIELGHATDTTITRASSGDLNIEGNLIYRAGGTDVPVADGGTGASSLTDNAVLTGTGTSAITAEGNLSFNGSTLAVTGAATVSTTLGVTGASTLDGVTITDNTISTNASNAPLELKANGTGAVKVVSGGVTFTLPTTDGSDGDVLKTDGSGTLSFASSTATASDDTRAVVKNNKSVSTSARTVDYFQSSSADMAWYFVALNDLTNDRSSASCFAVAHNDSDAFVSGPRGGSSSANNTLPSTTADMSSNQVRVKITAPSDDSKISYYKIPLSRANTSDATAGVTVTTSNTDVDSASETIDTFAHGTYRAAKYTILIDNNTKTETGVIEALVVHDGSTAYISQYGLVNTGSNDMITLTAQIVSTNVVVSAAGLEPNLSLKIHKTLLSDSMSAVSNGNQKIIGATTVSSSATAFDDFDLDDATAAMYYVVGGNAGEGHYSVYEVFCAGAPGEATVTPGTYVSTKGTTQLEFTAGFKSGVDNSLELSVSSTSGASTVVNAYRINALAE